MLSNEWQTDERENVLENHSTKPFWGPLLVLPGSTRKTTTESKNWNNSLIFSQVHFNQNQLCIVSVFATTKLAQNVPLSKVCEFYISNEDLKHTRHKISDIVD